MHHSSTEARLLSSAEASKDTLPTPEMSMSETADTQNENTLEYPDMTPVTVDDLRIVLREIEHAQPKHSAAELSKQLAMLETEKFFVDEATSNRLADVASATSQPYHEKARQLDSDIARDHHNNDQYLTNVQAKYTGTKLKSFLHKLGRGKRQVRQAEQFHAQQRDSISKKALTVAEQKQALYSEAARAAQQTRAKHQEQHGWHRTKSIDAAKRDFQTARDWEQGAPMRERVASEADADYHTIVTKLEADTIKIRQHGKPVDEAAYYAAKERALLRRLKLPLANEHVAEWRHVSADTPGAELRQEGGTSYYAVPKTFKQLGEELLAAKSKES